jgi:ABC-2 type transport system permease protein
VEANTALRQAAPSQWQHFLHVTTALAGTEFKLRYFGSALGYFWSFLRPLFLFGVLYVVFTRIVRTGTAIPHYPVALLVALVLYNFFAEATGSALPSLVQRAHLLRKVAFPRASVPIAVSSPAAVNLAFGLVIVLALAIINGISPSASWLLLVPVAFGVIVFALSFSLLLSILFVRYRDVQPIWEVILQVIFWATPIIYAIGFVPERFRQFVMFNPLAVAVQQARHWLIGPEVPTAADVLGADIKLLIPAGIFVGTVILGVWTFRRGASRVAEEL